MGIKLLWPMLEEVKEERHIKYLCWKTMAVDLSYWITQAATANTSCSLSYLCVRTLLGRIIALRRHQVRLVFVLDGISPPVKRECLRKRRKRQDGSIERGKWFNEVTQDCVRLFEALGIPYIQAKGEAEALCALLSKERLVDACITGDSDALLYGASIVIRTVNMKNKLVPVVDWYDMDKVTSSLGYTRRHLVAFSGLLEGDYYSGVKSVGVGKCQQLVEELPEGIDLIERFQKWKTEKSLCDVTDDGSSQCKVCHHSGTGKDHVKNGCRICGTTKRCHATGYIEEKIKDLAMEKEDFPPLMVFEEFLNPQDTAPESLPAAGEPSLDKFTKIFVEKKLGIKKTAAEAAEKLLPILVSWQLDNLAGGQSKDASVISPNKIVKSRRSAGVHFYEVEWKVPASFPSCNSEIVPQRIMKKVYGRKAITQWENSEKSDSDSNKSSCKKTSKSDGHFTKTLGSEELESGETSGHRSYTEESEGERSADVTASSEDSEDESDRYEDHEIPKKKCRMTLRSVKSMEKSPVRKQLITSRSLRKSRLNLRYTEVSEDEGSVDVMKLQKILNTNQTGMKTVKYQKRCVECR